jgi:hypothetical protein
MALSWTPISNRILINFIICIIMLWIETKKGVMNEFSIISQHNTRIFQILLPHVTILGIVA